MFFSKIKFMLKFFNVLPVDNNWLQRFLEIIFFHNGVPIDCISELMEFMLDLFSLKKLSNWKECLSKTIIALKYLIFGN